MMRKEGRPQYDRDMPPPYYKGRGPPPRDRRDMYH